MVIHLVDRNFDIVSEEITGRTAKLIKVSAVSTADTLTFNDYDAVTYFQGLKTSDLTTEVNGTISGNVVTISTTSLTDISIIALVAGSKDR